MARILLVEDDEAQRKLCQAELEDDGHTVEVTGSGDEALDRIGKGGIDVLVLDLCIEGTSGLLVLRRGLQQDPNLPIIIYTAYPEFQRDFSTWSAAAFLIKSSDVRPLKAEVARVLKAREGVSRQHRTHSLA